MLTRSFRKGLLLRLGEKELTFAGVAEFDFCLAGRTEYPASKIATLAHLSADEVKEEATRMRQIEKRFVAELGQSLETPSSVSQNLEELGHSVFSKDHDWRAIIGALNATGASHDDFKKLAPVKYFQYLSSRQDVLITVDVDKMACTLDEESEQAGSGGFRGTVIFDLSVIKRTAQPDDTGALNGFRR